MRNRGQSEALGFILVFGIVLLAIGLVTATGYSGLYGAQRTERVNNAVNAVELLADNVDDLVAGAPARTTEIDLHEGRLTIGSPVTMRVSGERISNPDQNFTYALQMRPVVYSTDRGDQITYVNGAVFRQGRDGAVMLHEPEMEMSNETTILPVVQTRGGAGESIGGRTSVRVSTRRAETDLLSGGSAGYDLTIDIVSSRSAVWRTYFESFPGVACTQVSPDEASCTLTTERLYLSVVRVDVEFR